MFLRFRGFLVSFTALLVIFSYYGCKRPDIVNTLSPSKFDKGINKESSVQLIDIRTPEEYNKEHIKFALNINPNTLNLDKKLLEIYNFGKPTYVYCEKGDKGPKMALRLEAMGFNSVYALQGGFQNWKKSGKPIELGPPPKVETGMTLDDLNKKIQKDGYVMVVYGSMRWNEPSMRLYPILDKIAKEHKDELSLVKVDLNDDYRITKEKNMPGIPFMELYEDGKLKWSHKGFLEEADILHEMEP